MRSRSRVSSVGYTRGRPARAAASWLQEDLERIADAPLEHVEGLVDAAEREQVGDERLGSEPSGRQQRQGTAHARATLAALGVDGDVAPHGVTHVGSDGPVVEG